MLKTTCEICNNDYTGRGMPKHLQSCLSKHLGTGTRGPNEKTYYLHVSAAYNPDYFLHLAVFGTTTLKELDSFLRDIWLECCGHLSQFSIGGRYGTEIKMSRKIHQALKPGDTLYYEYDFGDTTALEIKAKGRFPGILQDNRNIYILARNSQPSIPCDQCGKALAEFICTECSWDGESGWLCANCSKGHDCGEDMFLKVVNSPRTGVCGYNG